MPDEADKAQSYEDRTKDELLVDAEDRGLQIPSSAKKEEVIEALKEDDKAKLGAAGATDDEPTGTVEYIGPDGLVCDMLLPYQQDQGELVNGRTYEAPMSVIRQVVLNGNFTPADDSAQDVLDREHRRSKAGRLRAQRLLAGPAASGETAREFDRRVGIEREEGAGIAAAQDGTGRGFYEKAEFDPMEEFFNEEA